MVDKVYLQLRDGMAGEYLTVSLNMLLKGWNARWFYMKQSHPAVRCDVDHIPESQKSWSEMPSSADMEQVRELFGLIKGIKTNGGLVAVSFIVTQPLISKGRPTVPYRGRRCYRGT